MSVAKEEIARKFGKEVLLGICQELGMNVDPATHVWEIAESIVDDLEGNGVPLDDAVSDDLFEFMIFTKFITEDGVLIEFGDEAPETKPEPEPDDELPDELPECYGWGDPEGDRNCARCPIQEPCVVERDKAILQMSCFGVLYDEDHPDCMNCTIWRLCKEAL